MKHLFKATFLLLALLLPSIALAHDFEVNGIYYNIVNNTEAAVTYRGTASDTYSNEYTGDVSIPTTVTYSGKSYSVTSIGYSAFYGCRGLTSITIPNSVTSIGGYAFYNCSGLTNVTIPNSVTTIGEGTFAGCTSLASVIVESGNPKYDSRNNCNAVIETATNTLIAGCMNTSIPNSVTTIGGGAFDGCSGLSSVTIPNSVTYIGDDAFYGCSGLTSVTIPNSVTTIGDGAFCGCSGLTSIDIPNSVTYIGSFAFDGCSGLTSIDIPNSVTTIGEWGAFQYCSGLTSITVESGNPKYDSRNNCNAIIETATNTLIAGCKNTTIPNSVTTIGSFAFWGCITSIDIPNSVIYICPFAFYGCSGLTSVTIPNSVTEIDQYAFGGCSGLTSVICLATTPPTIYDYEDAFPIEVTSQAALYVPEESVSAYQAAYNWGDFSAILASDFEVDGVWYRVMGENSVIVISRPGEEEYYQGVAIVPSTVTHDGLTYNVTGIDYDAFANADLTQLVLPITVTDIDPTAFTDCHIGSLVITGNGTWTAGAIQTNVDQLYVMSEVTSIQGLQVNPSTVYSYSTVPPTCNGQTFTGYDGELHVPASSLAAYFTAPYWNYFINIIGDAVEPSGITLNKDSVELLAGNQLTLTTIVVPTNATPNPNPIIWISSNEQVVTVSNGQIIAVGAGECDVKAILLDKVAICHVTVTEILPTELTLSQDYSMLEVGSQLSLTATITPDDATTTTVTWETTNPSVATVVDGVVTAVGPGECFITASCGECQAACHVIVVEHFIYISLDQHKANLLPNHILLLTPTVTPVATSLVVTSSDPAVAAARLANGKVQVVGVSEGTAVITVASADGYATPDSCVVTVYTERGDLTSDGYVSMDDLAAMINFLLTNNADGINVANAAACDGHAGVGMDDLAALINFLLTNQWPNPVDPEQPEEPEGTQTITVNGVSFKMVPVEGGTFMMGATAEQGSSASDNEKPVHEVTVSSFNIGQTEVTQALWQAVMGNNPSTFNDDPNRPVECVSWNDCQEFVAKLNQMTGKQFRLPTEAEWEYAARGGNKSQGYKYAGSDNVDDVAWYMANIPSQTSGTPGYGTQPVASKSPNELCLYDMSGNVWEWCQDWFGNYSSEAQTDPTGPATGSTRVVRGGSWYNNYASNCRVSRRNGCYTTDADTYLGLRLVLDDAEVYTVNGVSFTMVPVKGGTFTMGATAEEDADYQVFQGSPQHQVTLSGYSIGQTEVTQELWEAVMGSNPSNFTGDLQRPVETVSWTECQEFITALNNLTGKQFRMPTEAEWEFAARGGNLSLGYTYAGSDNIDDVAWYSGNSGSVPHAVATKLSNELGIYDMCGNVNEWVNDWYSLYTEDPVTNPTGPETGMSQVHRGGRHSAGVKYCRITRRDGFAPGNKRNYLGMRLAL